MNTKMRLLSLMLLFAAMSPVQASKEEPEIDRAFKSYREGTPIEVAKKPPARTLADLLKNANHSPVEALLVMQELKKERRRDSIPDLRKLLKIHSAKTFKELFPDHWKYLKAIDYESMLCVEIEALIKILEKQE